MEHHLRGADSSANEIALVQQLLGALGKSWRIAALAGILVLVVTLASLFILRSTVPTTTTYLARFEFKFPSVQSGRFPNGDIFSLNEIIDPSIISPLYDKFNLAQFGIKRDDFFNAFSIRPYVPQEDEITERFQQQLADRRLTVTERERIEARLRSILDQGSRGGAEVSMTLRGNLGFPREVGRSVVQSVPRAWSQYAIETKGVLQLPGVNSSTVGIAMEAIDAASLPLGIVMLSQADGRLRDRFAEVNRIGGVQTVIEPSTRKSLRDMENDFRDLETFRINPLRGALSAYSFPEGVRDVRLLAEQRIRELKSDENYNSGIVDALATTASQFVQSITALKGRSEARRSGPEQGAAAQLGGSATIPQLSESFLDKVVELSARGRESDENLQRYISDLNSRQLATTEKLVRIKTEQEKWSHLLEELSSSQTASLEDADRSKMKQNLRSAAADLNRQWQLLNQLESEFAATRLSHSAQLYSLFLTSPDIVSFDPFLNRTVIGLAVGLAWLVFVLVSLTRALILFGRQRMR